MTVLVTGGGGQVATALAELSSDDFPVRAVERCDWDIADADAAAAWIGPETRVVVNAAAYTAVDRAEDDEATAFRVNDHAVGVLAEACRRRNVPLIHLSTDYVFDGTKASPYTETDPPNPIGVYGRSKAAGERRLMAIAPPYLVLRVAWVFGWVGRSFVETMLRLASRDELTVVDDQVGCPMPAGAIAKTIQALVVGDRLAALDRRSGIYHLASTPAVSWYEFAQTIFARALHWGLIESSPTVKPIPSSAYPSKAARPANSRLAMDKIEATFDVAPINWRDDLDDQLRRLK